MNNKFLYTSLVFVLLIGLFSCKKDPPIPEPTEPVMPPLTHQGLNTFGCYIDGELFVANEGWSVWSFPPLSGSFDEVEKRLTLLGSRHIDEETGESDDIRIRSDITNEVGEYSYLYNLEDGSSGYVSWHGERCNYNYLPDMPDHGKLTITYLNEGENIIAGTFYINLYNPDCEDDTILKITDGRFDFHY